MKSWMKFLALGAALFQTALATAAAPQPNVSEGGLAAHGYDLVAYFDQGAVQGRAEFEAACGCEVSI